jgi:FKBP-type peptidyl-prolyl cis-trans isomerase (trigger factor)
MNHLPTKNTPPKVLTVPPAEAYTVTPNTRSHDVHIEFKKEDLEPSLDRYWSQVKDHLHPTIVAEAKKGGFREIRRDRVIAAAGGLSDFYAPALAEIVEAYMADKGRQVLVVTNVKCTETLTHYLVDVATHLEPEVRWLKPVPGIDVPLEVKAPKIEADLADRVTDEALEEASQETAILVPTADTVVGSDGLVAVVDVDSYIDGQVWEDGRSTAKKWLIDARVFKVAELYQALLGTKQGETKEVTFTLPDTFGDKAGKVVSAKLKLVQLFTREKAPIDDDLAKSNGFDSLVNYRAAFKAETEENIVKGRKRIIDSGVYAALLDAEVVDVDPVPYVWMAEKAKEIYAQARASVETDEQLLQQMASIKDAAGKKVIENRADALTYFAQQAAQSLITDLVLRSWGNKKGVVGPQKLTDMGEYVQLVRAEVEKVVQVIEVDMNQKPVFGGETNAAV